ncbi:MAG: Na/Pi cotransporter family protein [Ferruginibacter sp.]|nr:Na/Pi cotransporter family protein [Ferruginibacter sp.]
MTIFTEIWNMLAGIALFLLGMRLLEESLQQLTGRAFKLFLKRQTASKPKAILGGAVVTAILQSSSVVNLMVLAFVGANVLQMQNALAVMLGSNLGTTFSSWIIATVGFKLNIENIAFPLAGIFGITMLLSNKNHLIYKWSKIFFGIGLLFMGLNFIRNGMASSLSQIDLSGFNQYPLIIFLLLGFIITAIIQSSTTTIAIVLSALHIGAIDLLTATAIVLGSEVGTIIKLMIASANGLAAKKRVALGNLLFNIITTIVIFIFLVPVNRFITETIKISDNLLALVFFQSLVNIAGIIMFYPFLNLFTKFLERRFTGNTEESHFIIKVKPGDTELAMMALENEVKHFILHSIFFTGEVFELPVDERLNKMLTVKNGNKNPVKEYAFLKQLHGETLGYAIQVQNNVTDESITKRLNQLVAANRNTMYAAKSIKDALPDITQLRNSSNDIKYSFYMDAGEKAARFCNKMTAVLLSESSVPHFETMSEIHKGVIAGYSNSLEQLYKEKNLSNLNEIEISTLINFNREMYTAFKSFLFAVKDYLLNYKEAAYFDELPGFIR